MAVWKSKNQLARGQGEPADPIGEGGRISLVKGPMFSNNSKVIRTSKTESEILRSLSHFCTRKPVFINRKTNRYYVFKTTRDKWTRTALSYYFVCSISDDNGTRIVEYKVVPALSTTLLFIIIPLSLIYGVLYSFHRHAVSGPALCISFFFNLLLLFFDHAMKREYIQEFEEIIR